MNKDGKVIGEIYARYYEDTCRLVVLNQGREEDARDVFQDALLAVFEKAQTGRLSLTSSFGAYLFSVSRLLWLRELKRRRRFSNLPVEAEGVIPAAGEIFDDISNRERRWIYRKNFAELTEDCRKVLLLFQEGKTIAEITQLMGFRSDQHTRNRRYRCKKCLIRKIRAFYRLST